MVKKLLLRTAILLLSGLLCLPSSAQDLRIDSILSLVNSANEARKIELYIQLARSTRNRDADTALYFANLAYALSEDSNNDEAKLNSYLTMGYILGARGSFDLARKYYVRALELSIARKNDSLRAASLNGIGNSHWQLGNHADALTQHFEALRIREKLNDQTGIASTKTNIGMVYQSQDKLEFAERYLSEALELLKNSDPSLQVSTMHMLANTYGQQGKIKEAFALDQQGIAIAERTNNEIAKSLFYDNMGNCYLYGTPPDFEKAIEYFSKTLFIDSSFGNKKQMSDSYVNLGDVFFQQKKYTASIPYLQRSLLLANESGYVQGKLKALRMLSVAYRESGMVEAAFAVLQQSIRVKDSLVNTSSESRIAELQTLYETEKQHQQISLQKAQLSKKNYLIIGIIVSVCLLGLLAVSGFRRSRLKSQARMKDELMKQQQDSSRAVIEAEEKERQRIARDLHDGVGQMMSAAKMNLSAFESGIKKDDIERVSSFGKIIDLVDESCKEIRNVSHNMMPNALLKNNLAAAVRDFIDKLDKNTLQVDLYTDGIDAKLDSNLETVLYRVIQECVNNTIRHAKATSLDISLVKDEDGISATIEDNGVGFDTNNKETFNGIGLRNIMTRVEYLKGTVEFDSAPERGTLVAIHIPLNK